MKDDDATSASKAGYFEVVGWEKFQQYSDRDPKWIKLYRTLLDDYEYTKLPDAARSHLVGIWLLAARLNNKIPNDPAWIAKRIASTTKIDLETLQTLGFIALYNSVQIRTDPSDPPYQIVPREEKRREEEIKEEERRIEEINSCAAPDATPTNGEFSYLTFPTSGTPKEWHLTETKLNEYHSLYGKQLDVFTECRKALQWCRDNPTKIKTARGMPAFLGRWMSSAVNKGTGAPPKSGRELKAEIQRMKAAKLADIEQGQRARAGSMRKPTDDGPVSVANIVKLHATEGAE